MSSNCEKRGRFLIQDIELDDEVDLRTKYENYKNHKEAVRHQSSNCQMFKITHNTDESKFLTTSNQNQNISCQVYLKDKNKYMNFNIVWEKFLNNKENIKNEFMKNEEIFKHLYSVDNCNDLSSISSNKNIICFTDTTTFASSNEFMSDPPKQTKSLTIKLEHI